MSFRVAAALLSCAALAFAQEEKPPTVLDFDKDTPGNAPEGFSFARTGQGPEGEWVIRAEEGAPSGNNVVVQASTDDTDHRFPVALWNAGDWTDVSVSVKFRPMSGGVDQAGGLVFRYKDANNYYVVRANALEGNVRIYFVKDGNRHQFGSKDVEIEEKTWHTLKVEAKGTQFTVWFDGEEALQQTNDVSQEAGKVGLWTKSDSVTWFDDLTIQDAP